MSGMSQTLFLFVALLHLGCATNVISSTGYDEYSGKMCRGTDVRHAFQGTMSSSACMARCNAEDSCTAFDIDDDLSCFLHYTDAPVPVDAQSSHVTCFIKRRTKYSIHRGVHYGGSNIGDCGIFATQQDIEQACDENSKCVGYSMRGFLPWCLKSSAEDDPTEDVHHDYYKKHDTRCITEWCPTGSWIPEKHAMSTCIVNKSKLDLWPWQDCEEANQSSEFNWRSAENRPFICYARSSDMEPSDCDGDFHPHTCQSLFDSIVPQSLYTNGQCDSLNPDFNFALTYEEYFLHYECCSNIGSNQKCDAGEAFESTGCQYDGGNCDGVFYEDNGIEYCRYCFNDSNLPISEHILPTIIPHLATLGITSVQWCGSVDYARISPGCVSGHNIGLYHEKTREECQELCDASSDCLAFEYGVNHGGSKSNYLENDCQLQSSAFHTGFGGCDGADYNLDLYIKPTSSYHYCPAGYVSISEHLDGAGKKWEEADSSRTIEDCKQICENRQGCTGFEFAESGPRQGVCVTFTGGEDNIGEDWGNNAINSYWRSCLKSTMEHCVTTLSVDHSDGCVGCYFNYDVTEARGSDFGSAAIGNLEDGEVLFVTQYRNNTDIWSGRAKLWTNANGGSVGDGHGRRDQHPAADQWRVGDQICFYKRSEYTYIPGLNCQFPEGGCHYENSIKGCQTRCDNDPKCLMVHMDIISKDQVPSLCCLEYACNSPSTCLAWADDGLTCDGYGQQSWSSWAKKGMLAPGLWATTEESYCSANWESDFMNSWPGWPADTADEWEACKAHCDSVTSCYGITVIDWDYGGRNCVFCTGENHTLTYITGEDASTIFYEKPPAEQFFRMTDDSNCEVQGDCVSSPNYPEQYGALDKCTIRMLRPAAMTPSATWAIDPVDLLIVHGVHGARVETANHLPGQIGRGEIITWGTDGSNHAQGWQICFSEPTTQSNSTESIRYYNYSGKMCRGYNWTATFEGRMSVPNCMARCNAEDSCTAFDVDDDLSCFLHQTDVPMPVTADSSDVSCFIKQRNICCEAYTLSCQACAENMTEEEYCENFSESDLCLETCEEDCPRGYYLHSTHSNLCRNEELQYCVICTENGSSWENIDLCSELNATTTTSMPGTAAPSQSPTYESESSSSSLALFLTILMVFSFQF